MPYYVVRIDGEYHPEIGATFPSTVQAENFTHAANICAPFLGSEHFLQLQRVSNGKRGKIHEYKKIMQGVTPYHMLYCGQKSLSEMNCKPYIEADLPLCQTIIVKSLPVTSTRPYRLKAYNSAKAKSITETAAPYSTTSLELNEQALAIAEKLRSQLDWPDIVGGGKIDANCWVFVVSPIDWRHGEIIRRKIDSDS